MSDLHQLPLLGHDLPLAADLRRQVRAKARVWSRVIGDRRVWVWEHRCPLGQGLTGSATPDWERTLTWALHHMEGCR